MRPERSFFFACAAGCPGAPPPDLDWEWLAHQAVRHRLAPAFLAALERAGIEAPRACVVRLHRVSTYHAGRGLLLTRALLEAVRRLRAARIRALPLKGPVLADALYDDPAHRPFHDIDLFVPRPSVARAWSVLEALGYAPVSAIRALPLRRLLGNHNECAFERGADGARIELHWRLWQPQYGRAFDPLGPDARREPCHVAGVALERLAAEERLVFLARHGAKHDWRRLGWARDIAAALGRGFDAERVRDLAERTGAVRAVRVAVALAVTRFGSTAPAPWLAPGACPVAARLAAGYAALVFQPVPPPRPLHGLLSHLAGFESPTDRFRYLVRRLGGKLRPNEHDRGSLVVRAVRLARQYGLRRET